jgi:hypothetical protein
MSDDWSLKGKDVCVLGDTNERGYDAEYDKLGDDYWFYEKQDIETLRQKLIEDIKQEFIKNKLSGYILYAIEGKINKRFGVA